MKNLIFTLIFFSLTISPILSQTKEEKKKAKEEAEAKIFESTKSTIESTTYSFEGNWATTQKGRRINLSSNANHLNINNSEADIDLPYFGQAYSGSVGLTGDGGIVFKGGIDNYKVEFNDKKQKFTIKFNATAKTDRYSFILTVFKNGNASLNVTSNHRSSISFDGKINSLQK